MKKEYLDVFHYDTERQEELEAQGYVLTGQIGGGDYGSCMIFSLPETEEERAIVQEEHEKQVDFAKEYWDWHNKIMRGW